MSHDVIIIGGSYAGLSAALPLGRARRDVLVIDAGQRRNRFVAHAYGIVGHDGVSPAAIQAKGKAEVLAYPTVRWRDAEVSAVQPGPGGFTVHAGGEAYGARKVILATGVVDELPAIPGLRERWGKTVFPCPYCDGYELNRGRLGVLAQAPVAGHYAAIVAEWSAPGEAVLLLDGGAPPDAAELADLAARGIAVEPAKVVELTDAPAGVAVTVAGGRRYELAGLFAAPNPRVPGDFARQLGCELDVGPGGTSYKTDPRTRETTVAGVYAAGDVAQGQHTVVLAMADGMRAGIAAHQALVFAHVRTGERIASR